MRAEKNSKLKNQDRLSKFLTPRTENQNNFSGGKNNANEKGICKKSSNNIEK